MIAAYMRISTTEQTLDRQRQQLEPFNAVLYWDEGFSRHQTDRPYFQKLIKHCQEGRYTKVIVTEPDRWGTGDPLEFAYYGYLLRRAGVQLVTVAGQVLNGIDAGSVLTSAVSSLTSRSEQVTKSERSTSARARDMMKFRFCGGRVSPGLDIVAVVGDEEKYRIQLGPGTWTKIKNGEKEVFSSMPGHDPDVTLFVRPGSNSWMVHEVFRRYADLGQSPQQIAKWLSDEKIPGFVKYPVIKMTVYQMLRNPVYIGLPIANKRRGAYFTEWRDGRVQEVGTGSIKPEEAWIQPESPLYDLLPRDLWERAQKRLKDRASGRTTSSTGDDNLWLRPLLYCGRCGRRMRASRGARRKSGYACASYLDATGVTGCRHYHVRHEDIIKHVRTWLHESQNMLQRLQPVDGKAFDIFSRACAIGNQMEELAGDRPYSEFIETEIANCAETLKQKETELANSLKAFARLPEDLQAEGVATLSGLKQEIEDLRSRTTDLRKPLEELFAEYADVQANIDAAADDLTIESLRRVCDRIIVHHDHIGDKRSVLSKVEFVTSLSSAGRALRIQHFIPREVVCA